VQAHDISYHAVQQSLSTIAVSLNPQSGYFPLRWEGGEGRGRQNEERSNNAIVIHLLILGYIHHMSPQRRGGTQQQTYFM